MGRCIISLQTGGGGLDPEELTALPQNVEKGKIAGVSGYDAPMEGVLRNLTKEAFTSHTSNEETASIPVVEGTKAYVSENDDQILRAQILFSGERGVLEPNTLIGIPQETMALAGGLTEEKLLQGQTAFGMDGTATRDATAKAGELLTGKTAYVGGVKVTGQMPDHGAVTTALNCGKSYTIPAGYHNGLGKVTANTLASQTKGNAAAADILKTKTAYVNGTLLTGTMEVQSVLSFSAAPASATQITCTWKNPAKGPFSGVIIIGKTGSYPTSITDGTRYYKGSGNNTSANGSSTQIISKLSPNTKYYFKIFSYCTKNNSEWSAASARNAEATAPVAKGTKTFTSSGTFTVPDGVTRIDVFCVGGGQGGGAGGKYSSSLSHYAGSGGCGGFTTTKKSISVTPGAKYAVTVGAGGTQRGAGGTSSFGSLCSAAGGGTAASYGLPNGGAGGGAGYEGTMSANGGAGGSDGRNGLPPERYGEYLGDRDNVYGIGYGQGTTTKAYGESNGTLYSGGGGGGVTFVSAGTSFHTGYGGAGGGGNGGQLSSSSENYPASAGSANTGGGGGGSGSWRITNTSVNGGNGGSGIVLVRWGY